MALSNVTFLRWTSVSLLAGLTVLLVLIGFTLHLAGRTEEYSAEVAKGRAVRTALVEGRSALQDAETGQRGYLLTGEESYLAPYERGRTGLDARLASIADLIGPGEPADQLTRLRQVVSEKLAELGRTVDLARTGRRSEALALVQTNRGKDLMDEARGLFRDLLQIADDRIGNQMTAQDRSLAALRWAVIAGAVLILLVVGSSTALTFRYTRELIVARSDLAALNQGLERRIAERTAALTNANQEIQRFAYVVSHDLRSPLVNIMGFTSELETMGRAIFAPEQGAPAGDVAHLAGDYEEAIGFIRGSIAKMDGLIGSILKLARAGGRTLVPELLDLDGLVRRAADDITHRVGEKGGRVRVDLGLPAITSDRLSLEQVFGNLLDNAVKYADPSRPPEIVVTGRRLGEFVEVDVTDNGLGIAAADRERVFELFRRAGTREQPGEGIGLSHVRTLIRRVGGDIGLRSQPGQGSTFTVRLPVRPLGADLSAG